MLTVWETSDEANLSNNNDIFINDESKYSNEDVNLVNDFNKSLIANRNAEMIVKFEEYFNENKNTIFMVGSAHIVGDNGIVQTLENKGYIVEKKVKKEDDFFFFL